MSQFPLILLPKQIKRVYTTVPENRSTLATTNPQEDAFFWYYLDRFFPGRVKRGHLFHSYTPDFIYFDPTTGLSVDIELDEPYVYDSGEPTHYQSFMDLGDNARNQFFLNHGWVIVRFSEEQIILYPESCCKTIAQVIADITKNNAILKQFAQVSDLPIMKQWTKDEAIAMGRIQYRDTYLHKAKNQAQSVSPTLAFCQFTFIDTLKRFINVEADTQVRHIKEAWQKPLGERVQAGVAIADIKIVGITGNKAILHCQQNISKFDKGDRLLLNRGNPLSKEYYFPCVLEEERDDELIVSADYNVSFDNLFPSSGWVLDRIPSQYLSSRT